MFYFLIRHRKLQMGEESLIFNHFDIFIWVEHNQTNYFCKHKNYLFSQSGFSSCLVHSDLWSPNILWEKDSEGRPTDHLCAIIDWQTVHSGNPCEDISRLLALNTYGQYRRENKDRLLEYYAMKVAERMGGTAPFTMEQVSVWFSRNYYWPTARKSSGGREVHKKYSPTLVFLLLGCLALLPHWLWSAFRNKYFEFGIIGWVGWKDLLCTHISMLKVINKGDMFKKYKSIH